MHYGLSQAIRISLQQRQRVVRDIPEAPTFVPTEQEFQEFFVYMKKILPEAVKAGIVKIQTPEGEPVSRRNL